MLLSFWWMVGVAQADCGDFDEDLSGSDSLQEALGCLGDWGTDTITLEPGWSGSEEQVTVSDSVTLQGTDEDNLVELPQLDVQSGVELTLENVGFFYPTVSTDRSTLGYVYGVHVRWGATVLGTNVEASLGGGVPIWVEGGEVDIVNLHGEGGGGLGVNVPAVVMQTGVLRLTGDTTEAGSECALSGFEESGAIYALGAQEVSITNCSFSDNSADDSGFFETGLLGDGYPYGGDIEVWGAAVNAVVDISACSFTGSRSSYHAGSILLADADATLTGNTFSDVAASASGGAILVYQDVGPGPSLTMADNLFQQISAEVGGALYVQQAQVTGSGDRFEDVEASIDGGVLLLVYADAVLTDWEMEGVEAPNGGAVYVSGYYETTLELDGTFTDVRSANGGVYVIGADGSANISGDWSDVVATSSGGLLAVHDGASGVLEDIQLDNADADSIAAYGAVVKVADASSSAKVQGGSFAALASIVGGGFASVSDGSLEVDDVVLQGAAGEKSSSGGAFYVDGGELTVRDSEVKGFSAADQGGAFYVYEGSITLEGVQVQASDSSLGGGVFAAASEVDISGSTLQSLEAVYGGGIYLLESELSLQTSYLCNINADVGAGLYASNSGGQEVSLDGVAMQMLSASSGGANVLYGGDVSWFNTTILESAGLALIENGGAQLSLVNNVLKDGVVAVSSPYGGSSGSYNLFYEVNDITDGSDDLLGTGSLEVDPQLTGHVPGECTAENLRPPAGSPVIDAGDPSLNDPNGSRSDMGAFGGPSSLELLDVGDTEDTDDTAPGGDTGETGPDGVVLRGGCGGLSGGEDGAAGGLLLVLLGLRRRRQGRVARKPS